MLKSDVKRYYGSLRVIANILGISKSAVSQWPEVVPQGAAYKLQVLTGGRLCVDATLYRRRKQSAISETVQHE